MKFKFVLPIAVLALVACAKKQVVKPSPTPTIVEPGVRNYNLVPEVKPVKKKSISKDRFSAHVVEKGESLWKISEQELGTPWKWPLLYRANRYQIADPDKIEPGQILRYYRDYPEAVQKRAVKEAERAVWPKAKAVNKRGKK